MPLIVLAGTFFISLLLLKWFTRKPNYALAGRVAMAVMLLFTAIGHILFTKGMAMMLPDFIPYKTEVIYATAVIEVVLAVALLAPRLQLWSGWILILYFIGVLPANIYAALHHIDYQSGTLDGPGPRYLWFRVPLQLLFIAWTWLCAIKPKLQKKGYGGKAVFRNTQRSY